MAEVNDKVDNNTLTITKIFPPQLSLTVPDTTPGINDDKPYQPAEKDVQTNGKGNPLKTAENTSGNKYRCKNCGNTYHQPYDLQEHKQWKHEGISDSKNCSDCKVCNDVSSSFYSFSASS